MKKLVLPFLCVLGMNAWSGELPRVNLVQKSLVKSNQLAFSTDPIPWGVSVTVRCSLNNRADFYDYLYVTPYSGSFSGIEYRTCTLSGCGIVSDPKVSLGMPNTVVNIYGVSRDNQAIVMTNYSSQSLYVRCQF